MENIAKTPQFSSLELHKFLGKQPVILPSTSLNEKFNIAQDKSLGTGDNPILDSIVIGNGGHELSPGTNNITKIVGVRRRQRASALYNHIPFILREANNDIPEGDRPKYRLRKSIIINGNNYIAYYAKKIDVEAIDVVQEIITTVDGNVTRTPYVPDSVDLNPTPPTIADINSATNSAIAVTAKIPFSLSETEVTEILNATNIIYGETGYGYISEIGITTGVDKTITGTFNNNQEDYLESIGCQLASSLNSGIPLEFGKVITDTYISVGTSDPLFLISGS